MKAIARIMAVLGIAMVLGGGRFAAEAATYYSIGDDDGNGSQSSLCASGPGWAATDGGAKDHCPCADFNSYAIRHDCRTPEANSDFVVKGYSHTLYTHKTDARASKIQLKLAGGKKVVFNNLISINGELTPSQPYKMDNPQILAGNLLIPEDGKFRMSIEIAYPTEHSHSLESKVRGSGEIEVFSDLGDKRNIQHHIRGDLSEFTGTIRSTGTTCRLLFGKEIAWPSDEFLPEDSEAYFDYSNGLTLVLPFSGELRTPRRKVDFGTTMQASVQVGSGCRVGMQSPLKGTTGFIKEGAGELVLEGSGEELSGAISVTAGTLAISNANAVGSCSLAMTSGSTLKLYPEATPKGVEVSAFPTGTWALKIVLPVRSRKVLKLPLLRVRDNAAATFGGTISAIEAVVPEGEGPASVGYEVAADGNDTVLYAKVTREKGYTPGLMVIIRGNEAKISD